MKHSRFNQGLLLTIRLWMLYSLVLSQFVTLTVPPALAQELPIGKPAQPAAESALLPQSTADEQMIGSKWIPMAVGFPQQDPDPALTWNTFLGTNGSDWGSASVMDGSGNVYVIGSSVATWGTPVRAFTDGDGTPSSNSDAFIAKVDASGALVWNTFLGGNKEDRGYEIAMDGSGNLYVTGLSYAAWGTPVRAYTSGSDAFVAKLDPNGALAWNTFLGDSGKDYGTTIALGGDGNLYIAGTSDATWGTPLQAYTEVGDAFVAKLNSSGALEWNTFLGGNGSEEGYDIAVDVSGNLYLSGYSDATWGTPVRAFGGGYYDGFAAKLDSSGALDWNTFLGGNGDECIYPIAIDGSGNIYVAGQSNATWGAPMHAYTGGADAFAAKLNSSDGALQWNTFLGGSGSDDGWALAMDNSGNIYVAGYSSATWGAPARAYSNGTDAFAAQLDASGALVWNTFLGGSESDYIFGIALDGSHNLYVAGTSNATWGEPVRAYTSGNDTFVAKLPPAVVQDTTAPTIDTFIVTSPSNNLTIPITAFTASDDTGVTGYMITESAAVPLADATGWSGSAPTTYTVASDGSYSLYPWAKDAVGNISAPFVSPRAGVVDTIAPTVTINQATDQTDPTTAGLILFTVVFSEPVAGFSTGDVTLSGTTGATIASVTGSGTTYTVSVNGMVSNGTVIADISAGVAYDAAGNTNINATYDDHSVFYISELISSPSNVISAGLNHTCVVRSENVWCWGDNFSGQLGNNSPISNFYIPVMVVQDNSSSEPLTGVRSVASGWYHTCALLDTTKTVKCWGYNSNGQLGNNSNTTSRAPVDVIGLTNVAAITSGWNYSCALLETGEVKCWGANGFGKLGDGTTADKWLPTLVNGLGESAKAISAGQVHTCAILQSGSVRCWGYNGFGQLGNSSTINSLTPVLVTNLTNASTIATGFHHSCAVTEDGTTACWGRNEYGQLGNNSTTNSPSPVFVIDGLGNNMAEVSAGFSHSCARSVDGAVECWGANFNGQLGNGLSSNSSIPVNANGLLFGNIALASGQHHSCIVTTGGGVKCWGYNYNGQLGTNDNLIRSIPTCVDGFCSEPIDIISPVMNTFTAAAFSSSFDISIITFSASDVVGVTGYMITESAVSPAADAEGWSGTVPATYTVTTNGNYTLYPWVKDAAGNVSVEFGPANVTVTGAFNIRYTTPVAGGTGDCSSWDNACSLQTALTVATSGDEIWVAAGTHKPTTLDLDPRTATFQLIDGVAVYGGFAGTEGNLVERDSASHLTILSGDIDNDDSQTPILTDLTTVTGNTTNSYHVVTGANDVTLDGFVITAGNANLGGYSFTDRGGGMYNDGSSPTLTNILFSGNAALGGGGGMYNASGSHPTLTNVIFDGNAAESSGGGMENYSSSPALTNVTFSGNRARLGGGGMRNSSGSNAILTNVTFSGNLAYGGGPVGGGYGGGMYNQGSSPTLTNVTFSGNSSVSTPGPFPGDGGGNGGGMYNDYGSNPQIRNTIFWGNTAATAGAQIYSDNTSMPSLSDSVVQAGCPAGSTCANLIATDPKLGALGNYGGFTQTIPLTAGSSAIDRGNDTVCPTTDQRGVTRPQGAYCDIGAFERTGNIVPIITQGDSISVSMRYNGSPTAFSLTLLATDADGDTLTWSISSPASHGTASASGTGNFKPIGYTPNTAYVGSDSFVVQVDDGDGGTDLITVSVTLQAPEILYATPGASGTGDCSSWANSCALQNALTTAINGDEIWAATGTYQPTTGTDRSVTFQLKDGVALYGGFAGMEITRNQRDPATNLTILSGDLNGNDNNYVNVDEPTRADNSYHVVTGVTYATLDGFVITGGNANLDGYSFTGRGGGMYNNGSSPTLTDVAFKNNSANFGGGMFNIGYSNVTLTNVTFDGNSALNYGGGMANQFSNPTLTNITFNGNSANNGGGMSNELGGNVTLTNVTFNGNSADNGGGMLNIGGGSNETLTNVTFSNNSANYGGGMSTMGYNHATLTNVTFSDNSANYGGGICNWGSNTQIRNTIFWGNTASSTGEQIYVPYNSLEVSDSVIQGGCTEGSICTNIITTDPKLDALGDYGGFTHTIPLLAGSSAIDTGNDAVCPATDQRGMARPQGTHCDIGTFESVLYNISGNTGIGGATITYTSGSTTANSSGGYFFSVPSGWIGTITPSKTGYFFTPSSITISTPVTANLTGQNFTATSRAFVKYNPVNGAAGVSTSPLLTWQTSQGADSYEYCIDITNDGTCEGDNWISRGTNKSVAMNGLTPNTTYYWQVRAVNPDGTTDANAGAWWPFTTTGCYTLTTSGNPSGSVSASPATNCTGGKYTSGTVVQLTPKPASGYAFSTWSGALSGSANPASVMMDSDKSVTANFITLPGSFVKYSPANGATSVTINPVLNWQTSTGAASYEYCIDTSNDTVCDTGWVNRGALKSVGLSGLTGNTTYYWQARAVNTDGTVEANSGTWWSFTTVACYTLTTNGSPTGSVYASPATNCTGGKYTAGTVVQLSPRPAYGYTFSTWSGDLTGSANPSSVTMNADKSVTANFSAPPTPFIKYNQANGATGVSINPLLNWGTSINAASYEYCLDTSNDTVCDTGWISRGSLKSVVLSGLTANTTYYWQVRAVNAANTVYANGGTWWSFTTAP